MGAREKLGQAGRINGKYVMEMHAWMEWGVSSAAHCKSPFPRN